MTIFKRKNGKLIRYAGNSNKISLPVGSIFASAIPLTDARVHLLDGSSILQNGVYTTFTNLIKVLADAGNSITCTIDEYAVDVALTGNCGKFVINDTNTILSNTNYNKIQNAIVYEGYRLNSTNGLPASSGSNVVFIPAKKGEILKIYRANSPSGNTYIYETTTHGVGYSGIFTANTYSQTQYYEVLTDCKYVAVNVNTSDFASMTVYNANGEIVVNPNSIKLPTVTTFIQGLSSITNIGSSLSAGLPNITGTDRGIASQAFGLSGAFYEAAMSGTGTYYQDASTDTSYTRTGFDASRSNSIYGNSATVQPNATRYPYYIVLASGYKSSQVVDVDNVVNELNNVISELNNVKDEHKIEILWEGAIQGGTTINVDFTGYKYAILTVTLYNNVRTHFIVNTNITYRQYGIVHATKTTDNGMCILQCEAVCYADKRLLFDTAYYITNGGTVISNNNNFRLISITGVK